MGSIFHKRFLVGSFIALLAPSVAGASGIAAARFGGEHGHPTTDNATAVYYNPAGLAFGDGTKLYIDGTFLYRSLSYTRPVEAIDNRGTGTPEEAILANSGKAQMKNVLGLPFLGLKTDLGIKNFGLGFGAYVPWGGSGYWEPNKDFEGNKKYPGAIDGVQRWWSMDGSLRSFYLTAASAYYFQDFNLSLGVGLNGILTEAKTIRATSAGTDDLLSGASLKEGRSLVDAKGFTGSLSTGLIFRPMKNLWFGASYQSMPGLGLADDNVVLKGKLKKVIGAGAATEQDIEMRQSFPDVIRVGARFRPTHEWELRLFGDYMRWSKFVHQCVADPEVTDRKCSFQSNGKFAAGVNEKGVLQNIMRKWQDAFGVRAGASYFLESKTELYLGLGYDGNAIPDETLDPTFIDTTKGTVSLGAKMGITDSMMLAGTFTQVIYVSREKSTEPRQNGQRQGFLFPSDAPDSAGKYAQWISLLNVGIEYTF